MENKVIGITGGIGSGKTTVSEIIEKEGFTVLYADDIAKEIMLNDKIVYSKISNTFGIECFRNGVLQTQVLAEKVFNHPEKIKKLNSIVHPPTIREIEIQIIKLSEKYKLVFVEAALIFEAKMDNLFDYIILVTADEDTRIKRVLERDVETVSEIKSRIMNQIPDDKKRSRSDFVLENNGNLDSLKEKTLFFLDLFQTIN